MVANWTFEKGQLVARNPAGELISCWPAQEALGRSCAYVLNQAGAQTLNSLLLAHAVPAVNHEAQREHAGQQ